MTATQKERLPSMFKPSEWRPFTRLTSRAGRDPRTLGWAVVLEILLFAFIFALPSVEDTEFMVFLPLGAITWMYGTRIALLVGAFDIVAVVTIEMRIHSWSLPVAGAEMALWSVVTLAFPWFMGAFARVADREFRASAALRRSEALLSRTLDGADTAIASFDKDARLLYANRACLRAHGARLEDVAGKTHVEAFGCSEHQEALARVARTREPIEQLEIEMACMSHAGDHRYWDWRVDPITIDGDTGVIAEARDVTQRHALRVAEQAANAAVRESEARLRQMAEGLEDVFFLVTPDFSKVIYVNSAYERLTGAPVSELSDDPLAWLRRVGPEDQEAIMQTASHLVRNGESATMEARLVAADGAPRRWVRFSATPLLDAEGKVVRIAGVVRETTRDHEAVEAARREEANEQEIRHLKQVTAFKSQFLNTAAHELATPITPLQFELRSFREGFGGMVTGEQKASLDILSRSVDRLTVLVHDLLDAARLDSGRLRLYVQDVALGDLARECAKPFERVAAEARVAFEVDAAPGIVVRADPTRVMQVLTNLIDNALRYTPEGGRVGVSVRAVENEARIEVRDTGRGLTPEQIAKLFQPFSQVQPTGPYRGSQGSGLGLFISKGIIEAQGGRIWCESTGAGQGSAFTIALPLRRADSDARAPHDEREALAPPA